MKGLKNIKCSTGEIAISYNAYLNTKHWNDLRVKVAEANNYTCIRCCGVFRDNYHVHHNNYKRIGKEQLSDLSFYCNRCHSIIHNERKNKRNFNRSYSNMFSQKMSRLNKEQIEEVLKFIDSLTQ